MLCNNNMSDVYVNIVSVTFVYTSSLTILRNGFTNSDAVSNFHKTMLGYTKNVSISILDSIMSMFSVDLDKLSTTN